MGQYDQDPMDAGVDWNRTGYGTGTPGPEGGVGGFLTNVLPWVVGGGMALGGLQAAGMGGAAAGGGAGAGAGGAGAAASGLGGTLAGLFKNPQTYAGLAGLISALASRPGGGGGGGGALDPFATNPQLQEMLGMSADRARRTDPLHQAVTQLAMNRLPINVQR
jgi:hypothetical protein